MKKSVERARPVIIATQMLESMTNNFSATRAEINDVSNSVFDGADALMLSGETSIGIQPLRVVDTMRKTIKDAEKSMEDFEFKKIKEELEEAKVLMNDSDIDPTIISASNNSLILY